MKIKFQAPDGKTLVIEMEDGLSDEQIQTEVDGAVQEYMATKQPYSEKIAGINSQTGPNIQAATKQAQEESAPDWQMNLYPYSSQELAQKGEASFLSGVKDVFSMPGRAIGATFDEMRQTSENTPNPFAAALKSPVTGATALLAPATAGMSLAPAIGTTAAGSVMAGLGMSDDYGTVSVLADVVLSAVPALGPALKVGAGAIAKSTIANTLKARGIIHTPELIEKVYDNLLKRYGSVKGAAKEVRSETASKLANDMDINQLDYKNLLAYMRSPADAEQYKQLVRESRANIDIDAAAGRTRNVAETLAAKTRIPQLNKELDYLVELADPSRGLSPVRIREELQNIMERYADIPEAIDLLRYRLSQSTQQRGRDLTSNLLEDMLSKALGREPAFVAPREALPWSNYIVDLNAAASLADKGVSPQGMTQYLPNIAADIVSSPTLTKAAGYASSPMTVYLPQAARESYNQ